MALRPVKAHRTPPHQRPWGGRQKAGTKEPGSSLFGSLSHQEVPALATREVHAHKHPQGIQARTQDTGLGPVSNVPLVTASKAHAGEGSTPPVLGPSYSNWAWSSKSSFENNERE